MNSDAVLDCAATDFIMFASVTHHECITVSLYRAALILVLLLASVISCYM